MDNNDDKRKEGVMKLGYNAGCRLLNIGADHSVYKLIDFFEDALGHDDRFSLFIGEYVDNACKAELKLNDKYILTALLTSVINPENLEPSMWIEFYTDKLLLDPNWGTTIIDIPFERNISYIEPSRNSLYRINYIFCGPPKDAKEFLLKYIIELDQNE